MIPCRQFVIKFDSYRADCVRIRVCHLQDHFAVSTSNEMYSIVYVIYDAIIV